MPCLDCVFSRSVWYGGMRAAVDDLVSSASSHLVPPPPRLTVPITAEEVRIAAFLAAQFGRTADRRLREAEREAGHPVDGAAALGGVLWCRDGLDEVPVRFVTPLFACLPRVCLFSPSLI